MTFSSKGLWKKSNWKLFSLTNKIYLIFKLLRILCRIVCTLSLGPGSQVRDDSTALVGRFLVASQKPLLLLVPQVELLRGDVKV